MINVLKMQLKILKFPETANMQKLFHQRVSRLLEKEQIFSGGEIRQVCELQKILNQKKREKVRK